MGDGILGDAAGAATISGAEFIDASGTATPAALRVNTITQPASYDSGAVTSTGFAFGGPGAVGASCCTPTTCHDVAAQCGTPADNCGSTLQCGTCSNGAACSGEFICPGEALDAGVDATVGDDAGSPATMSSGGCCDAGDRGDSSIVLALLVGVSLCFRRRCTAIARAYVH